MMFCAWTFSNESLIEETI